MEKWYLVRYRLYNMNNVIHFSTFAQYQNWLVVMEENFSKSFEIREVISYHV